MPSYVSVALPKAVAWFCLLLVSLVPPMLLKLPAASIDQLFVVEGDEIVSLLPLSVPRAKFVNWLRLS